MTFMSTGDDIQEIYIGSGMIMNGEGKGAFESHCLVRIEPALQQSKDTVGRLKFIQHGGQKDKCYSLDVHH